MKIKISVTKEILEASKMCGKNPGVFKTESCAIALAIRDVLPDASVQFKKINTILKPDKYSIPLPPEATKFIFRFDNLTPEDRTTMSPISFEIDVPDSYIESIGIEEVKEILSKSKSLVLVNV